MDKLAAFVTDLQKFMNTQCLAEDRKIIGRRRVFDTKLLTKSILNLVSEKSCSYRLLSSMAFYDGDRPQNLPCRHFSPSSFCEARKKLSPYFFVDLSQWVYRYIEKQDFSLKWFGRNIFCVDSTRILLPKELEEDGFYSKTDRSYYPSGNLATLYNLRTGLIYDCLLSQDPAERMTGSILMSCLPKNSVLIADRAYFSYRILHQAFKENIEILLRMSHQMSPAEIKPFFEIDADVFVDVEPTSPSSRMLKRGSVDFQTYTVRIVSYLIGKERYVLLTTIFDEKVTRFDLANLYRCRWDIEEHFKFLKESARIQKFHSKSVNGVLQELFACLFLSTVSRAMVLIEKNSKTKLENRVEYSPTIVFSGLCQVVRDLIGGSKAKALAIALFIKECIFAARYKFRPRRKYPRRSYKVISRWCVFSVGVRY